VITDAHTAPDQHQKLTTSRGSPLAHADPMFHRRPQMHSSVILVSQRSLMPGWGLACADTLYKYTFTLLYRHSEWQTNSSDHITLPWPNVGPVFRRLNKQLITIIITTTMFMVLSSRQSHCESSLGSFDECRMAPSGRRPKTKPDDLESACTGCQNLHPPSPFIIITQPESWYSFYHPTEGRKLSRTS